MQLSGHLRFLEEVHSDYEIALMNAAQTHFGAVTGCFFHYSKAIVAKFKKEGLQATIATNSPIRRWMKLLIALALLPQGEIVPAYHELNPTTAIVIGNDVTPLQMEQVQIIYQYFAGFWINRITPAKFSVYGIVHRTTNDIENYHLRLLHLIKVRHGNLWSFLSKYKLSLCSI